MIDYLDSIDVILPPAQPRYSATASQDLNFLGVEQGEKRNIFIIKICDTVDRFFSRFREAFKLNFDAS